MGGLQRRFACEVHVHRSKPHSPFCRKKIDPWEVAADCVFELRQDREDKKNCGADYGGMNQSNIFTLTT